MMGLYAITITAKDSQRKSPVVARFMQFHSKNSQTARITGYKKFIENRYKVKIEKVL